MTPSSSPPVLVEMHGHTAVVTLNRPDSRNSLDLDMRAALLAAVQQVRDDAQVRSVVLTGSGKAFCAGGDIRLMQSAAPDPWTTRDRVRRMQLWFRELCNLEKPVVAAVNGAAFGAGLNLALAADFVLCADNARLCASFSRLGVVPDLGGLYLLPRMVGLQRAKELVYTAREFSAQEAHAMGLAYAVRPAATLRMPRDSNRARTLLPRSSWPARSLAKPSCLVSIIVSRRRVSASVGMVA